MRKRRSAIALAALLCALFGIGIAQRDTQERARPEGRTYRVAQAGDRLPRILAATIDPLDVHVGQTQALRLVLQGQTGLRSVTARIEHDRGADEVVLLPTLPAPEDRTVAYEGSWIVHDTHDTAYRTTFVAEDDAGNRNGITLAWSDACGIPPGGSWTLSSPCAISANDGVDGGDVTIDGSLVLDADFAFNAGRSFAIVSGSVLLCEGCSLLQTALWQVDADGDGYPANGTMWLQDAAPPSGRRRSLLSAAIDCNDGAFSLTNACTAPSCWPDADGDGYFSVNATTGCTGSFSTSQGSDCYDASASVHPGQASYFGTHRGDGSFDYDCDGAEEKYATSVGSCLMTQAACDATAGWKNQVAGCGVNATTVIACYGPNPLNPLPCADTEFFNPASAGYPSRQVCR